MMSLYLACVLGLLLNTKLPAGDLHTHAACAEPSARAGLGPGLSGGSPTGRFLQPSVRSSSSSLDSVWSGAVRTSEASGLLTGKIKGVRYGTARGPDVACPHSSRRLRPSCGHRRPSCWPCGCVPLTKTGFLGSSNVLDVCECTLWIILGSHLKCACQVALDSASTVLRSTTIIYVVSYTCVWCTWKLSARKLPKLPFLWKG